MREGDRCLRCLNGAAGKSSEWHDFVSSSLSIASLIHTVLPILAQCVFALCLWEYLHWPCITANCQWGWTALALCFCISYWLSSFFCRVVVSVFPTGCLPSAKWSRTNALGHISCAWWLYIRTDWFNMCAHWECTSLGSAHMEWAVVCVCRLTVCLWFLCTCVCWQCTCS